MKTKFALFLFILGLASPTQAQDYLGCPDCLDYETQSLTSQSDQHADPYAPQSLDNPYGSQGNQFSPEPVPSTPQTSVPCQANYFETYASDPYKADRQRTNLDCTDPYSPAR